MAKSKHDTAKSTAKRPTKKATEALPNNIASAQSSAALPLKKKNKTK